MVFIFYGLVHFSDVVSCASALAIENEERVYFVACWKIARGPITFSLLISIISDSSYRFGDISTLIYEESRDKKLLSDNGFVIFLSS